MSNLSIINGQNRAELISILDSLEVTAGLSQAHKLQLINEIEKLVKRYHRNKSWQVDKRSNERNLLSVRNDLTKGQLIRDYSRNVPILVRLTLGGYKLGSSKQTITKAFKKAKASLASAGRQPQTAEKILITKLCLLYLDLFGELPLIKVKKQFNTLGNSYYGIGLNFVILLFQTITKKNNVDIHTLGHYVFKEVKRISMYVADYKIEKNFIK